MNTQRVDGQDGSLPPFKRGLIVLFVVLASASFGIPPGETVARSDLSEGLFQTGFRSPTDAEPREKSRSISTYEIADPGHFYTRDSPVLFFHNMAGYGIYPYSPELLQLMARFETIWAGNVFPLPPEWVDHLHAAGSKKRSLLFYELFTAVHFIYGKETPQPYEAWQVAFLDEHKLDFHTINPLVPPDFQEFAPGRHLPGAGLLDYFINYGRTGGGPESFLVDQFYDVKRAEWGYDGIFLDLMGSAFMKVSDIQDPLNPANFINAHTQYLNLASTRSDAAKSYDENGAAFLSQLRARNPDIDDFPLWGNQAYRSGDPVTGRNPYYEHLQADLDESSFTTWYNLQGWTTNTRVLLDGTWHEGANPVETRIIPYTQAIANLQPFLAQLEYSRAHHEHPVQGVLLNYVRPFYKPREDGYEAVVDREAIYYGYAAAKSLGLNSFAWDFFDTFVTIPGVPGAPPGTGLPPQGYYRWAFDPIYFLDLGDRVTVGTEPFTEPGGKSAHFIGFEKGFIVINSSQPAQDFQVNLSGQIPDQQSGVFGIHDHFTGKSLPSGTTHFLVPAAYYPIGATLTNSARVFSYADEDGNLIGTPPSVKDMMAIE